MTIECKRFKSFEKGCLQGFADLYCSNWGVEILGCTLYMKNGKRWVNLPGKTFEDENGEKKSAPFMRFPDKSRYFEFSKGAVDAIDEFCKISAFDEKYQDTPVAENARSESEPCNDNAGFNDEDIPF